MIDINLIREKPEWVKDQLLKRMNAVDFTEILKLDEKKRKLQQTAEKLRAEKNTQNKGQKPTPTEIAAMKARNEKILSAERDLAKTEARIFEIMSALPNIPLPEVTAGGKENNRVVAAFGKKPALDFKWEQHPEIAVRLGLIDYERAAKISGAKTWIYTGAGALLEWALLNYFIDFHIANGYKFIMPPHLLNWDSGYAAGQFPKFADDVFMTSAGEPDGRAKTADFNLEKPKIRFLLPTAETALINLHRNEIIPADKLPIKYFGYSPCYRKEAGSYRTEERGMIRGYQFNKVEMFIYCLPEDSPKYFEELVRNAQKLVEGLGLHFNTVALAAGDCSAGMAKTYDIEVYIPSMRGCKEVSSVSNATDFQCRRANIRTKDANGKSVLLHTLNASGLATSRLIPAILEQFQQPDGSVAVPPALHKYMHGITVLR